MNKKEHPLVLVFYLDRDLMQNQEITKAFAESINHMISVKQLNALALFMPTDGEERIECINPVIATDEQISHITKLIDDIKKQFSIGDDLPEDIPTNFPTVTGFTRDDVKSGRYDPATGKWNNTTES